MQKMQIQDHVDFYDRQRETLESFQTMMSIKDVKMVLGLSVRVVIELVQAGRLPAYKIAGEPIKDPSEIDADTHGLRFLPSDVEDFIKNARL